MTADREKSVQLRINGAHVREIKFHIQTYEFYKTFTKPHQHKMEFQQKINTVRKTETSNNASQHSTQIKTIKKVASSRCTN